MKTKHTGAERWLAYTLLIGVLATNFAHAAVDFPIKYKERIQVAGQGSAHITVDVSLSENGFLAGTLDYENDSLWGFGGQVHVAVFDDKGNILAIFCDPGHNVSGKGFGRVVHSVFPYRAQVPADLRAKTAKLGAMVTTGNGKDLLDLVHGHVKKLVRMIREPLDKLNPDERATLAKAFVIR